MIWSNYVVISGVSSDLKNKKNTQNPLPTYWNFQPYQAINLRFYKHQMIQMEKKKISAHNLLLIQVDLLRLVAIIYSE